MHSIILTFLSSFAPQIAVASAPPPGLCAEDWSSVRAARDAELHAACAIEGGFQARNPRLRWHTRFDERGFTTVPDGGAWVWGLELVRYGFAGSEREMENSGAMSAADGRVACARDSQLTEWYVNDSRGLEHGYTLRERPPAESGALAFTLAIRGGLTPEVDAAGRNVRFVDGAGVPMLDYAGLVVTDADGCPLAAHFDVVAEGLRLEVDDRGARYPLTIDPLAQQAYLKASNTGGGDNFGCALSVSADTIAVGAFGEASNATGVNGNQSDNSLSAPGAVYIFVRSGSTWVQQAYIKASNTGVNDFFGRSVALSGDTLVVGAHQEDSNATGVNGDQSNNSAPESGAAYVFVRSGTTWSQQAYLKASNTAANDNFGFSVAASGDTIVVGAYGEDSNATGVNGDQSNNSATESGAAYVFVRSGTTWSQEAYVKASNAEGGDTFGYSVALSGDTLVAGAKGEDSAATGINGNQSDNSHPGHGAAYVFVRSGTTWSQEAYVKPNTALLFVEFGWSLAVSGDLLIVGTPNENSRATGVDGDPFACCASGAGAAWVFARSGSTWSQQAYLKAHNTPTDDFSVDGFGYSVAASGDRVLVGAWSEDSDATGVNGSGVDPSAAFNAGAAYLFSRSGTTWTQQAYLKASNPGQEDRFGQAVALTDYTALVGAPLEDSNATGVNGTGTDLHMNVNSGAAYVFDDAPYQGYCFGDGLDSAVTAACPCANFGNPGHGCANSNASLGGALLVASGTTSPNTLLFTCTGIPNNNLCTFLRGTMDDAAGVVFGDGVKCASGTVLRFGQQTAGQGGNAPNTVQSTAATVTAGNTRYYQVHYRNPSAGFCPPEVFNVSSGARVTW